MATEDIIEAALTSGQAFVLPPSPRNSTILSKLATESVAQPVEAVEVPGEPEISAGASETDTWKQEYDAQVEAWRAQSAEAREKSDKEREKWEAIRREEAASRKTAGLPDLPEEVPTGLPTHRTLSSAPAESETLASSVVDVRPETPESRPETNDGSQKWEEIQASTSSFPSMSFPERTQSPSPPPPQPAPAPQPTSATLAIFDSSLSTRTRVIALFSALAINLALPFINGVMLGFGEIFAKNVVLEWFGWRSSGSVATNVGIGSRRERKSVFR